MSTTTVSLRRSPVAPQLARGETHRIDMLRFLALKMGVGVGKDEHAVIAIDRAELAPRIAWQARVVRRIDVPGAHALTRLRTAAQRASPPGRHAIRDQRRHIRGCKKRIAFFEPRAGFPLSISPRVTRPILTSNAVNPIRTFSK